MLSFGGVIGPASGNNEIGRRIKIPGSKSESRKQRQTVGANFERKEGKKKKKKKDKVK